MFYMANLLTGIIYASDSPVCDRRSKADCEIKRETERERERE